MKRSLLVAISLLSSTNSSFGMLDDPLIETEDSKSQYCGKVKELRPKGPDLRAQDPRYEGRSAIYNSKYSKMPMVHPYNHGIMANPFSAALSQAHAPQFLEDYHAQHLSEYKKVYSFVVQPIQGHESDAALKPHYFVHPDAPTNFAGKDYQTSLRWTVVPGAQGQVEPQAGNLQTVGLLTNVIDTHRSNPNNPHAPMGVSADVMHLKGLDQASYTLNGVVRSHIPSKDFYSLVAFADEKGNKIAAITYHWLLCPALVNDQRDYTIVKQAVGHASTLRELITGLEKHAVIGKLTGELKKYVDFSGERSVRAQVKVPVKLLTDWTSTGLIKTDKIPVKGGDAITVTCNFSEVKELTQVKFINTAQNKYYDGGIVVNPGTKAAKFTSIVPEGDTHTWLQFHNLGWNNTPHQIGFSIQDIKIEKALPIKLLTDWTKTGLIKTDKLSVKAGDRITVTCQFSEVKEPTQVHFINTAQNKYYEGGVIVTPGMKVAQFTSIVPDGDTHTWLQFHNLGWNNTPHPIGFSIQDVQINLEDKK
jgi:hypothetical protein